MDFSIRRLTPPPLMDNFQTFFYPTFFLLQLNPTYMKRIFVTLKLLALPMQFLMVAPTTTARRKIGQRMKSDRPLHFETHKSGKNEEKKIDNSN